MIVKSLYLKKYRSYAERTVEFSPTLNVLVGENAVGKTNMLEAVYLCGVGKSPRAAKEKELVKFGESTAVVRLGYEKKYRTHRIEILINAQGKKNILVDGLPMLRVGELLGGLNVVWFSPDELNLVKEGPENRRRFLDISLSQQQRSYFLELLRYDKVLENRNKLLKFGSERSNFELLLEVYDEQLATSGTYLIEKRVEFLARLKEYARASMLSISGGADDLDVAYDTDIELTSDIKSSFLASLKADREKDLKLTYTCSGPHRDDIKLTLGGVDVRRFGSQGQQRSCALALKLGEMEFFKSETNEKPVLLLDDVLSELDLNRQKLLLKAASGAQVILTCTHYDLDVPANIIKITKP